MYSTCKGPLIDVLEANHNLEFTKKVGKHVLYVAWLNNVETVLGSHQLAVVCCSKQLEISEGSDFTQEWLYDILHPQQVSVCEGM